MKLRHFDPLITRFDRLAFTPVLGAIVGPFACSRVMARFKEKSTHDPSCISDTDRRDTISLFALRGDTHHVLFALRNLNPDEFDQVQLIARLILEANIAIVCSPNRIYPAPIFPNLDADFVAASIRRNLENIPLGQGAQSLLTEFLNSLEPKVYDL